MKFTINKALLVQLLSIQTGIVEKKTVSKILSHILIEVKRVDDNDVITITGTDMENSLIVNSLNISAEIFGSTTVCIYTIYDIVRKLSDDMPIIIEYLEKKNFLKVVSGNSEFILPTIESQDFPCIQYSQMYSNNKSNTVNINAKKLQYLINQTKFAMSSDECRRVLNGILFDIKNNKLTAIATDAHRLALCSINFTDTNMKNSLVARKAINELSKFLDKFIDDENDNIEIKMLENYIIFSFKNIIFASRLLEGQFPNYNLAIPTEFKFEIQIMTKELKNCVELVSVLSSEKNKFIKLTFQNGKIIFSAQSEQYGYGIKEIDNINYVAEEEFIINCNPRYILDVCNNIKSEHITMKFKNSTSTITIVDSEKESELYLIMPVRI